MAISRRGILAAPDLDMANIFVVLGMHKSGTTLVAELLHHSGVNMVETLGEGDYSQKNFYEREATNSLNKSLLRGENIHSLDVPQKLDQSQAFIAEKDRARRLIKNISSTHHNWGFKDPRTCLTYDFWKEVLPHHRIVAVFRSDQAVHAHYTKRKKGHLMRGLRALRAWYDYNFAMLEALEDNRDNFILLDYEELMKNESELRRLEQFLSCPVKDRRHATLDRTMSNGGRYRIDRFLTKFLFRRDTAGLYKRLQRLRTSQNF